MKITYNWSNPVYLFVFAFLMVLSFNSMAQNGRKMTENEKEALRAEYKREAAAMMEQQKKEEQARTRQLGYVAIGVISVILLVFFLSMGLKKKNSWGKVEVKQRPIKGGYTRMGDGDDFIL